MTQTHIKRVLLLVLFVGAVVAMPAMGFAAAQTNETADEKAPVYGEEDPNPDTDGWLEGIDKPSVDSIVTLISRMGTFVIGGGAGGSMAQSAPALLTGIMILGTAMGMTVGSGVGSVGGSVLAIAGVFATIGVGLAPEWGSAIVVFGVGIVVASVFRRLL